MEVNITKMDHLGCGIGFINDKIIFIPKTIPGDVVDVRVLKDNKTYMKGNVIKYIKRSGDYIKEFCPFYEKCGGCQLQNLSYEKTIEYKFDRVKNILNKIGYTGNINVVKNENDKYYRNKIELKIVDGKIGYYQNETHTLNEISSCMIAKKSINSFIPEIQSMNITNGDITIRSNYNDELLINIYTKDNIKLLDNYSSFKVVGIILNDKCIYGDDHFMEMINNMFFEISYDSFFQVNSYINSKLFNIISNNVSGDTVLDLYSGVGTLSLMASKTAKKVYAIEVVKNAVINAIKNAKINNVNNVNFILGDASEKIKYINDKIDTIIIDPPRGGLTDKVIDKILELKPNKIVLVSCELQKTTEDLKKLLDSYTIKDVSILDMFSYTYHCESITVLERK